MLKANSKKILDIIAGQEAKNGAAAYKQVHPNATTNTAKSNAHQLLKKPEAQIYLQKHVNRARERVVELVDAKKEEIALRASQDILDREYGKATQKVEQDSRVVTLNLSLSALTEVDNTTNN